MLKFLRYFLAGFGSIFGNLFSLFGAVLQSIARLPKAVLETCGFIQSVPELTAANEAEAALNEARRNPAFGTVLDKRTETWTPEKKTLAIVDWCEWRIGHRPGPEPSLAGLSTRERLKLRAADENTVKVLPLRTLPVIESWLNSPIRALEPQSPSQLAMVKQRMEMEGRESEKARASWIENADRLDPRAAVNDVEAHNVLRVVEEALNFRPGSAFA